MNLRALYEWFRARVLSNDLDLEAHKVYLVHDGKAYPAVVRESKLLSAWNGPTQVYYGLFVESDGGPPVAYEPSRRGGSVAVKR